MLRAKTVIAVLLMSGLGAACGSGSKSTSKGAPAVATQSAQPSNTTASSGDAGSVAAVTSGPVRATLRGADHAPVVSHNWIYVVTAGDSSGHPLSGTVDSEFVYGGQVVGRETPPTHPLKDGRLRDVIQFPAASVGVPLSFQTVVHTPQGSVTLDWPIKVRR